MPARNFPLHVVLLMTAVSPLAQAAEEANSESKEAPACKYCPETPAWSGWVEAGIGYQNNDDYHFGRYTGEVDEGGVFDLSGEVNYRREDGIFFDGTAENLGLDSRRLQLRGGNQGRYEIGLEYDEIPNYRESSAYSPFIDLGNGRLGLPEHWSGGSTTWDMPDLGASLHRTELKTERDRTSANFSLIPVKGWEVSGYVRAEEKEGVKDQGATFGFSQTVILPAPIKYETDEFGVTLGYTGDKFQSQLAYSGSLFKNDWAALQWRNPYEEASSDTAWGQMADAPDNQFHQISAILGYQLREDTRVGMRLARGRMTQDEDLLPYTVNPAINTSALPVSSADAQIDTTLASIDISSRPTAKLRLDASYTYSDRDNKTDVNAYDYVVTDLGPGGTRINRPYSFEQNLLRLKAAYRLPYSANLSVGYDDDEKDRTYLEVEETDESTVWAKLTLHPLDSLEATLKYAYADREASDYVPLSSIDPLLDNPNANFYNNPLMRVMYLADRTRSTPGLMLSYSPVTALSLGLDLDYSNDEYSSDYLGLQEATALTYTLSANYSFNAALSGTAFYTYDKLTSDQKGSEKMFSTDPESFWIMSDKYLTQTFGLGVTWHAIESKLDLGADLTYADYTGSMDFAGAASLPELGSTLTAFTLRGTYNLSDNLSLRAQVRYERYEEDDWTKSGYVNEIPTLLALGTAPHDEDTYLALVSLRYKF